MASGADELTALRSHLRSARRALDAGCAAAAADDAASRLLALPEIGEARIVATYVASDGEIDPSPVSRELRERGVVVVAPRFCGSEIEFAVIEGQNRDGRYGIPEPAGPTVTVGQIDVVVTPLVGVDNAGNRLGRGGGHYDTALSHLVGAVRPARPFVVGIGYDFQLLHEIPVATHDVPVDAFVSPTRLVLFGARS